MRNLSGVDMTAFQTGEQLPADGPVQVVGYTLGGGVTDPESPGCLAREVRDPATGKVAFYLKRATRGPDTGLLFNPNSPYYVPGDESKLHGYLGKGQYEWRPVRPDQYEAYCRFLKSGNTLHLRQAERE